MIKIKNNYSLPQRLFIQITEECNLKCAFCSYWQKIDSVNKVSLKDKIIFLKEVINWLEGQNKDFRKSFRVILTGGEPFLYPDEVFGIAKLCSDNNIACDVNTNGSLLGNKIDLYDLVTSGLKVTVSIDSHIAETHDKLRRNIGLFKHIISIIKEMDDDLTNRFLSNNPITLWVQSILGDWNIKFIYDHINFFKDLGVDGLLFQPLQYTFGVEAPKFWYDEFYGFPKFDVTLVAAIKKIGIMRDKYPDFIINSEQEINSWRYYFQDPERLIGQTVNCKAPEQNILVDTEGDISFCGWHSLNPKNKIGNITKDSIKKIWNGKVALREKEKLKHCNKGCATAMCNVKWE